MTQAPGDNSLVFGTEDFAGDDVFVFPASFAQQRLWFLDQLEPDSPFYNIPAAVRLNGALVVPAFEQALNEVVARHETLRTTFATVDEQPVQVIAPELRLALPLIDLSHLPSEAREAEALRLARHEARQPFNLARGPLLRATLLRLSANQHIVLLTMHHIISDGWSMGVLVGELGALYAAFSRNRPSPLPELPIQYADFADWQRSWLQGAVLDQQIGYWKEQLAGVPTTLELPTDRPRPALQSPRGGSMSLKLPRALSDAIKTLGQREGATPFMTLLAAFQTLLYRYSGQEDFCVGSPIANRTRSEVEPLIGFFVNTLVLRARFGGDPTFRELLRRTRQAALGAFAHQDLPFEMLVEAVQPERDLSRTPLFQVMFILQNAPTGTQQGSDLLIEQIDVDAGTATFDLTFSLAEQIDGIDVSVEYSADLFDAPTISRMLGHFEVLLSAAASAPETPVSRLPLLTPAERHTLLVEWNDPARIPSSEARLIDLFEAEAARQPAATAVAWGEARLSYGELNARANQLAHYLRSLGVGPETLVGVCLNRSLDLIVAVLGVLKAGGAYIPLDPSYPPERLQFMLDDARPAVVLTDQASADFRLQIADWDGQICNLQSAIDNLQSTANPTGGATPDNLAYIIYTSGSTGQSKGVMVTHRNLASAYYAWETAFDLRGVARCHLQMASFSFDVFSGDLARALGSGGTLVLCPREALLQPEQLEALINREQVTIAEFVPAVLRGLAQHLEAQQRTLASMRVLICGSDSWFVSEYRRFRRLCGPQARLLNTFGLTEATIDSTYFDGGDLDLPGEQLVPIGRPLANSLAYVLDAQGQPLPIGVPGELFIGGAGVARGYLNRPALTAERFVEATGGTMDDGRWTVDDAPQPSSVFRLLSPRLYKTGDRARFLADGNIEFLGRVDFQIKIRGHRIEPGEIEALLAKHPAVRAAVVTARDDAPGGRRLVAYIVENEALSIKNSEPELLTLHSQLKTFLKAHLPDYMVPSAIVPLAALPLTPNGKVDRNNLPAPDWSQRTDEQEFIAPRTPTEQLVAGLWAQIIGVDTISAHDNFFDIGGHSLLATQLISRARTTFALELPLRVVFEAPTLAEFAERVDIAKQSAHGMLAPAITPADRSQPLPLSFAQQRLWFLDQLEPGSASYNIPESVQLYGNIDIAVLERALNAIVQRHEVLRTCFITEDGLPRQQIAAQLHVPLPLIDLQHLPAGERDHEMARLATEATSTPFDLTQPPLLRALLLRLAADNHVLVLTIHHIISDVWSTGVLIAEFAALYRAFAANQPSPLPALPIQYADFAAWQRGWLQGDVLAQQLGYWKERLAGAPPLLELPTDRPRPSIQTFNGAYSTFSLPTALSNTLRSFSKREGATLFMTMLAAFDVLMARYSGQDDICIGTPIANRTRAELEPLIGFFVNTLVLRADLSANPSFRALVQQVREAALGAYAHQDLPFEMIVDAVQPERSLSHTPLFQVMFTLQNTPVQAQELPGLRVAPVEAHSGTSKFDMTVFVLEEGEQVGGAIEYNSDLFDRETISQLISNYTTLLEHLLQDAERRVLFAPILSQAEAQQILIDWNQTDAPYPADQTIHALFEQQVRRTPDAAAVTYEDATLSFAELNQRANQLAHRLRALGVGPDRLVGLCIERSLDLLVGLYAILKAGGAYVPLDPSYPVERLAAMLADAEAPVVIANAQTRALVGELLAQNQSITRVDLDTDAALLAGLPTDNLANTTQPEDLAYVIFTSGSTGRPKGVMIPHRAALHLAAGLKRTMYDTLPPGAKRITLNAPLAFDASVQQWVMMIYGHTLDIIPQALRLDGAELVAYIRQHRIDVVDCVPTQLKLLLAAGLLDSDTWVPSMMLPGGEALEEATWRILAQAPATTFWNVYGPTECAVDSTTAEVHAYPDYPTIGRPLPNVKTFVLDKYQQPVPVGVAGELYIAGAGVGRGYYNRPELTAERFVSLPFATEDGGRRTEDTTALPSPVSRLPSPRLYRTGDRVRYRRNGTIEFLGRIDHQVKIRGFRMELGEIETVLGQHPAVREAVVLAREDQPGVKRLVAYVVPTDVDGGDPIGDETSASVVRLPSAVLADLRAFLKTRLPEYMVPAAFVLLEALPLTPNGKLDRKALPTPDLAERQASGAFAAPTNPTEQALAAIWSAVIGVERVGIHDNFFELGGDSIMTVQVVARANQAGLRLTPRQLFQHPTIAELAAIAVAARPAADQAAISGPTALTPLQYELLAGAGSNRQAVLLLEPRLPINAAALETALATLVAHHDALRLQVANDGNGWQAQILANTADALLSAVVTDQQVRLTLDRLVADQTSWQVVLEDLQTAYLAALVGSPAQLPLKTASLPHWAAHLASLATSAELERTAAWWQTQLGSITPLPVKPTATRQLATLVGVLAESETSAWIDELNATYRASAYEGLLAAAGLAISEWANLGATLVAAERDARAAIEGIDVARTIGNFTARFPVRIERGDPASALQQVKAQLRDAPQHGLSYGLLREHNLASLPVAQVHVHVAEAPALAADAAFTLVPTTTPDLRLDEPYLIGITGQLAAGQLRVELCYDAGQLAAATIEQLIEGILTALRTTLAHGQASASAQYTVADFADFGWNQDDLSDILAELGGQE